MKKLIFFAITLLSLFWHNSNSQVVIFTNSGDTIYCSKFENKYPNSLYWIEESQKPIKIKAIEIRNVLNFPVYELTLNQVDEFTGKINLLTERITFGSNKSDGYSGLSNLTFSVGRVVSNSEERYFITLYPLTDLGCSGSVKNYAVIKFINGEVLKLENDLADINCGESAYSLYRIDSDALNKLTHNKVKAIRLNMSESFEDYYTIFPECVIKSLLLLNQ